MLLVVLSKCITIHVCMVCRDGQIMVSETVVMSGFKKFLSIGAKRFIHCGNSCRVLIVCQALLQAWEVN